ncbi:homoserine dehydrogenase [Polaribacter irgensii 23-P]|uniref:Homoserine dehydrogenase n=1 Tax=Polaribacter irgensii 23-P TaxID=313594 RepID=A4C0I4_9FLAO|nr:hypothetical protein [Polaribacter irgensii]EAR12927.1 homoserine dehydrogenase [Polaribacter irgensii 23-P]
MVSGIETATELNFSNPLNFETDAIVTITGVLKLNSNNVAYFNYILAGGAAVLAD